MSVARFTGTLNAVGDVRDVAFSPDGTLLATAGGNDHTVLLWDTSTGEQVGILINRGVVDAVAFSPDGQLVATGTEIFAMPSGQVVHELAAGGAYDLAFSPDGSVLATASGYDPSLGVRLHDPATGDTIRVLTDEYANSLAFSPDGRILATGHMDKGVLLWNPATGALIRTLSGGSSNVVFSPDGKVVATSGETSVGIWNAATGGHIGDIDANNGMAFIPDGTLLATGKDKVLRLYDPDNGNLIRTLDNVYAHAAAVSPDGERVATVRPDRTVRIVDISFR